MDKLTIGRQIKYERERLAMTQLELGRVIGVTKQCVSGWEVGRTTPDAIMLSKLAALFNVDISYFLQDSDNYKEKKQFTASNSFSVKEVQIISKLRAMSPERRKAFEILIGVAESK